MPHGLQGFLPHMPRYVGGHQHGAEFALSKTALTLISEKRIKKAGRALPALSDSSAEQTGELNFQTLKTQKIVSKTVDSAIKMRINTQSSF